MASLLGRGLGTQPEAVKSPNQNQCAAAAGSRASFYYSSQMVVRVPTLGLVQTPEPPQGLALIALDIELGCKVYTRRASRSEGIHMARSAFADAKRAAAQMNDGLTEEEIDLRARALGCIVRGIYREGAISIERVAQDLGIDSDDADALCRDVGMEFDGAGNIVGAALSTRETPHIVRIGSRKLYAWCAMDTLVIPGLLNETAEIESTCPVSGETIRVTVAPDGVVAFAPQEAALSVALPGSARVKTGPASPT